MSSKKKRRAPYIELTFSSGHRVKVRPFTSLDDVRRFSDAQPRDLAHKTELNAADSARCHEWLRLALPRFECAVDRDVVAAFRRQEATAGHVLPESDRLVWLIWFCCLTIDDLATFVRTLYGPWGQGQTGGAHVPR